jgi:hypothetical protein
MLLCVQGNSHTRYADDVFENVIKVSDGYRYLDENNNGQDNPYCLWDNFMPYRNQVKDFMSCLQSHHLHNEYEGFLERKEASYFELLKYQIFF